MKHGTIQHHKTKRLARLLNVPIYAAVGLLECLWHMTGEYAPRGNIGKIDDAAIEDGIGWTAGGLVSALIESKWIDRSDEHRLLVHDWPDHCDYYIHNRIARKTEFFADGQMPMLTRLANKAESAIVSAKYAQLKAMSKLERSTSAQQALNRSSSLDMPVPVPVPCLRLALPAPCLALPAPCLANTSEEIAASPPPSPTAAEAHAGKPKKPKAKPKAEADHQECVRWWCESWADRYSGAAYPFGSRDGKCVKDMLATVGSGWRVREYMRNYLETEPDKFYAGHPLVKLAGNLPAFAVEPGMEGVPVLTQEQQDENWNKARAAWRAEFTDAEFEKYLADEAKDKAELEERKKKAQEIRERCKLKISPPVPPTA